MAHTKPLSRALDLRTYAGERMVCFKLVGMAADIEGPTEVLIPYSIAFRLHYMGRAFDGQVVKAIRPGGMTRIDFTQLQVLSSELQLVAKTTTDPVSQHYLAPLLSLLAVSAKHPSCALTVSDQATPQV